MTANLKKGFTLIELLIVIAILGVLAVVVLIALNPVQQLARTRDSGRLSGVTQLGHAIEAYATTQGIFPAEDGTGCTGATIWAECLTATGEINSVPSGIADSLNAGACTTNVVTDTNGNDTWSYDNATGVGVSAVPEAIVFATLEAQSNIQKCPTAGDKAYAVYSTTDGRGGIVCLATGTEPSAGGPQPFVE